MNTLDDALGELPPGARKKVDTAVSRMVKELAMIDVDKLRGFLIPPQKDYFPMAPAGSEMVDFGFMFPQSYWKGFEELCALYGATLVYDPEITDYWCYRTTNRTIRVPKMEEGILSTYEFASIAPHELAHAVQYVCYESMGGVVEEHDHPSVDYQAMFEATASELAYDIYKLYFNRFWPTEMTKDSFMRKTREIKVKGKMELITFIKEDCHEICDHLGDKSCKLFGSELYSGTLKKYRRCRECLDTCTF